MAEFDHKSGKIPPKAEGLACMQIHLQVKFVYQVHQVKVKVKQEQKC